MAGLPNGVIDRGEHAVDTTAAPSCSASATSPTCDHHAQGPMPAKKLTSVRGGSRRSPQPAPRQHKQSLHTKNRDEIPARRVHKRRSSSEVGHGPAPAQITMMVGGKSRSTKVDERAPALTKRSHLVRADSSPSKSCNFSGDRFVRVEDLIGLMYVAQLNMRPLTSMPDCFFGGCH